MSYLRLAGASNLFPRYLPDLTLVMYQFPISPVTNYNDHDCLKQ